MKRVFMLRAASCPIGNNDLFFSRFDRKNPVWSENFTDQKIFRTAGEAVRTGARLNRLGYPVDLIFLSLSIEKEI